MEPWFPLEELVQVLYDQGADLYYFDTGKSYVFGVNVGGYGRKELATLYITGKLSLSPSQVKALGQSPAEIRNVHGVLVLADDDPSDGLDPLMSDPSFHPGN